MTLTKRRVLAGGTTAAIVIALSGALIPTAAIADEDSTAPTVGAEFDATAKELLATDGVEAVVTNADGEVVVYTTTPEPSLRGMAETFVDDHSNVIVEVLDAPFTAQATTDVVGGAGYVATETGNPAGALCSIGFAGWTPDGNPAMISAGHCTVDGALTTAELTLPTGDTAGGGDPMGDDVQVAHPLGDLTFSQFGGPGNTIGGTNSNSTDISVWDIDNTDLTLLPEVTDWTTSASEDLSLSTTAITEVGEVEVGEITKSGRTTGLTTGVVEGIGWAMVEDRMIFGFGAYLDSVQGDSGGAMYQGETAVGILSGNSTLDDGSIYTWGADLETGLALTGGYTVALDLDAPELTSDTEVGVGDTITGTGPADSTLVVTPAGGEPFEVEIDGNGEWSFDSPDEVGVYDFTAFARNGFNVSDETVFSVQVLPAAPVFTSPGNDDRIVTEVTEITGTGEAGATIELTGDVTDSAIIGEDGTWSITVELGIGEYDVTARQTSNDVISATRSISFAVIPTAPVIDSPVDGERYANDDAPTVAEGTGIEGASISLELNGDVVGDATVTDGAWSIAFTATAGEHTLVATQTVNGQSNDSSVDFTVAAAPSGGGGGSTPGDGSGDASDDGTGSGDLAETGMSDITPYVGGGLVLLLAGIALMALRRARSQITA